MNKSFYVYILASNKNGTLYVGITSDLVQRIWQHKNEIFGGFTKKYNVKNLLYYEEYDSFENAVSREKRLKDCKRQWKLELIEKHNPNWNDLYESIVW